MDEDNFDENGFGEVEELTAKVNDTINDKFHNSKLIRALADPNVDELTASAADEYMDEIVIGEIAKVSDFKAAQNAVKNIRLALSALTKTTSPEVVRSIMILEIKNAILSTK